MKIQAQQAKVGMLLGTEPITHVKLKVTRTGGRWIHIHTAARIRSCWASSTVEVFSTNERFEPQGLPPRVMGKGEDDEETHYESGQSDAEELSPFWEPEL